MVEYALQRRGRLFVDIDNTISDAWNRIRVGGQGLLRDEGIRWLNFILFHITWFIMVYFFAELQAAIPQWPGHSFDAKAHSPEETGAAQL